MRIRLFTIPNIITLSNLLCGVLAIVQVLVNQNYTLAFWLVVLAAIADFFDGFAARALGQQSPLGVQLDSLSDLISFGLAPTFVLFSLALESKSMFDNIFIESYLPYLTFIVVAFSSLRLAKFNIDEEQSQNFIGLPTPANALACMSLGLIYDLTKFAMSLEGVVILSVVMSILLIAPIKMFSLKFKGVTWRENCVRYIFLAIALGEIILFGVLSMPLIIATYIVISITIALAERSKNRLCA